MKKFYLEVITGAGAYGVTYGIAKYQIEADRFEYSNSGNYVFYSKDAGQEIVVAAFPIQRTIIAKIEMKN